MKYYLSIDCLIKDIKNGFKKSVHPIRLSYNTVLDLEFFYLTNVKLVLKKKLFLTIFRFEKYFFFYQIGTFFIFK